jgi:RNA polymerase sigma factor (sigma-70 family)
MPLSRPEQSRWFSEEVQPHEPELRAYLRGRFPSLGDIDDIVQETYARLFRLKRAGSLEETRPYLFATARNTAIDIFRHRGTISLEPLAEISDSDVVEERPGVAEALSRAQEIDILHQAIDALPGRCREILVLRKLQGCSHREIAQRLGISENTVNAQIALGVLRCRAFLRARGVLNQRRK